MGPRYTFDNVGIRLMALREESVVVSMMMVAYSLLAAIILMNMLVGILCEVVSAVVSTGLSNY